MLTLHTERLTLRPVSAADFAAVHAYASDAENTWYLGVNTEEDTREYLSLCEKDWAATPLRSMVFAIELDGKVIGSCALWLRDEDRQGALCWILHRDYWNRGYATEAAKALLDYGFTTLHLHRIYADADGENLASMRVMEKLGMRREGYKPQCVWSQHGTEWGWHDLADYAILESEYDAMLHPVEVKDSSDAAMKARRFS